ncbi:MAG: type IV secretory system conjugative DNA transfer family protein, partial [bacterium]|nr:type IV secretory system conjugative DNA transfer family protein [bacterium]
MFPRNNPHLVSLNPFGAVTCAFKRDKRDLIYASENANMALIPEPEKDEKNAYFREEPRTLIEFCTYVLMKRNTRLAIPGGVWALLGNPAMLHKFAAIEAEEGDGMLQVLALNILEMFKHEHFSQHRSAALKALRIFSVGTRLHDAGASAKLTHADLIREGYVIFIVGPQAYMNRLGAYYALHILAFNQALYLGAG